MKGVVRNQLMKTNQILNNFSFSKLIQMKNRCKSRKKVFEVSQTTSVQAKISMKSIKNPVKQLNQSKILPKCHSNHVHQPRFNFKVAREILRKECSFVKMHFFFHFKFAAKIRLNYAKQTTFNLDAYSSE